MFLDPDAYVVLDTGDPMPEGFDAVVMREHVHYDDAARAELRAAVAPYQHVRSIGEDVSAAELLLPTGHRLRAVDVAAAAAAGAIDVLVHRAPVVAVLPTGDEIRPVGTDPAPGVILDTNSLMLVAQAEAIGATAWRGEIVRDEPDAIAAAVRDAAARADLVIVVAGSSAGRDDHTAAVVERLGALAVHGVAVRPGHPVVLGAVDATPVLGAPGYPVSASLTFDIFAAPLLAALEGATPAERPRARARLARKLASPMGMDDWVRVRLGRVGGELVATPLPRGAGVLTSLVRADGLLVVPAGLEGHHAGEHVDVTLLRGVGEIDRTIVAVGSHDLVLDLAASELRAADPGVTLASSNVGSLGGLVALRDGLCHIAGSHLLDPASGEYTLPYVDRVLGEQRRRGRPPGPSRAGPHRGPRQSARPRRASTTSPGPACATSTVSAEPAPGSCSTTSSAAATSRPTRSPDTRARSTRISRSRPPSPPGAPTPASASWPPRARSTWTSCPSLASPTTWCSPRETLDEPAIAPLWALLGQPGLPLRGRGARRLRDAGDGSPDPLTCPSMPDAAWSPRSGSCRFWTAGQAAGWLTAALRRLSPTRLVAARACQAVAS